METLLLCPLTFSGIRAHQVPRQRHLAPLSSLDLNPTYRFWSLSIFFFFFWSFRRGCFHFIAFFSSHVFYPWSKQLGEREVLVFLETFPLSRQTASGVHRYPFWLAYWALKLRLFPPIPASTGHKTSFDHARFVADIGSLSL